MLAFFSAFITKKFGYDVDQIMLTKIFTKYNLLLTTIIYCSNLKFNELILILIAN